MKRIKIQKALLLSLLFSSALFADIRDRIEYKLERIFKDIESIITNGSTSNSCTQITQADFVSGVYTIIASGEYCVAENVTGLIIINASSVCIDLQCHIVSAGVNANAFSVSDQSGIRISNGTVANAGDAGILAVSCNAVELSDLYFVGNDNDAIRLNTCTEAYVHGVSVVGGAGNRAINLLTCSETVVANCDITGYTDSTAQGILEIVAGECVSVRNVEVSNCVFGTVTGPSPFCGGIHVATSSDVVIENSQAHNMSATSEVFANGILIDACIDSQVIGSQMHGNQANGIEIVGANTGIAIIECVAMQNIDSGFDFDGSATATSCLVQDCRSISNIVNGFSHGPSSLMTTFIGNEAQLNGSGNYNINGGIISLQGLSWNTGFLTIISGNAAVGSRFTNLTAPYFPG